jgi:hypothetical protein
MGFSMHEISAHHTDSDDSAILAPADESRTLFRVPVAEADAGGSHRRRTPADQHEIDRQRRGDSEQQETGRASQEQPEEAAEDHHRCGADGVRPESPATAWIPELPKERSLISISNGSTILIARNPFALQIGKAKTSHAVVI